MELAHVFKVGNGNNQYTQGSSLKEKLGGVKSKIADLNKTIAGQSGGATPDQKDALKSLNSQQSRLSSVAEASSTPDKPSSTPAKSSGAMPTITPSFKKGAKLTIQSASEALSKQGIKLEAAGVSKDFKAQYKLTDKDGNTTMVSASDLTKSLTKKEDLSMGLSHVFKVGNGNNQYTKNNGGKAASSDPVSTHMVSFSPIRPTMSSKAKEKLTDLLDYSGGKVGGSTDKGLSLEFPSESSVNTFRSAVYRNREVLDATLGDTEEIPAPKAPTKPPAKKEVPTHKSEALANLFGFVPASK